MQSTFLMWLCDFAQQIINIESTPYRKRKALESWKVTESYDKGNFFVPYVEILTELLII